jgi:hypothetical protein
MARRQDYIPPKIAAFHLWQKNLVTLVVADAAAWGITPVQVTELAGEQNTCQPLFGALFSIDYCLVMGYFIDN